MSRALYVYWKIEPAALDAALRCARKAQDGLRRRHPGLDTGLWCRETPGDRPATVMETYQLPGGVSAAAEADIEAALALALAAVPAGPRHVEAFRPA